jgi:hypothetical protein
MKSYTSLIEILNQTTSYLPQAKVDQILITLIELRLQTLQQLFSARETITKSMTMLER